MGYRKSAVLCGWHNVHRD